VPKKSLPILILVFFTLTFSSCTCIYFNTFHNIRKNFNGAEKTRKKDGRDEARGAEVKQYNDAIAKASWVLERHPTSGYVDDALYIIGASYFYLGEHDKAARKFKELFANYPESEYASRSRVLLAKAKLETKEETEAIVIFEEIFEKEHDKQMKADAARSLGEFYFENKDYALANVYFNALIDSLGEANDKLRARLFVADGYYERYDFSKARENYDKALQHDPDTLQIYRINFRMAECDYFMNDLAGGLQRLEDLADNEFYYDSLAPIRLKMAEGYEWDGDFEEAIKTYDKVIVENPESDAAAFAYYNLGLIYQYDFEDLDEALEYYQKARDEKRSSSIYPEATRRASKLALLKQYVSSGEAGMKAADSSGQIEQHLLDQLTENQFKLGELFYYDLDKPDSAIHAFQILLERYPESRYAPRSLMSMGYIHRDDYADTATHDSLLREVLKQYPRYDEAEDVINLLGLAGTAVDTGYGSIVFARAEKFLEEFIELDSSEYFMSLVGDSILAADSARRADSVLMADSLKTLDSLKIEDLLLTPEGAPPADTAAILDSLRIADSIETDAYPGIADSIRVADSIRYADARRKADSIQQAFLNRTSDSAQTADSIRIADSLKAMELMRMAESLRETELPPEDDSVSVDDSLAAADSILPAEPTEPVPDSLPESDSLIVGDSTVSSDTALAVDSSDGSDTLTALDSPMTDDTLGTGELVAPRDTTTSAVDSTVSSDTALAVDSSDGPDTLTALDSLMTDDTLGIGNLMAPQDTLRPVTDSGISPDSNLVLDSLAADDTLGIGNLMAPRDSTTPGSRPLYDPDNRNARSEDSLAVGDLAAVDDSLTVADSLAEAEPEIEEPKIEYWQIAFDSARNNYDPELYGLLDSAQRNYRLVVDSFPFSDYSIQARYVLLWMFDRYLAPGDSSLIELYRAFADSFPNNEYAQAISDEYGIRSSGAKPRKNLEDLMQDDQGDAAIDSSLLASDDSSDLQDPDSLPSTSAESKFITDEDGKILEPADKYYLRTNVPFEYPLEALAWNIENKLYFQIRIDFSGEVAEVVLMNETPSNELNERILETVRNTVFDAGRIPPEWYDHWFYYTYMVKIPANMRQ
jgi:tetratricopeptide (TPR) repeat protein